jgi:hypothetical protein
MIFETDDESPEKSWFSTETQSPQRKPGFQSLKNASGLNAAIQPSMGQRLVDFAEHKVPAGSGADMP